MFRQRLGRLPLLPSTTGCVYIWVVVEAPEAKIGGKDPRPAERGREGGNLRYLAIKRPRKVE